MAGHDVQRLLEVPLPPGGAIGHWQRSEIVAERFDVADQAMTGEMDPFFFLTRHKNFIPHEYPCRSEFSARYRHRRPDVRGAFAPDHWWLPFGSPRLDLSGFWFRPTRIACWARTFVAADHEGEAVLRLGTCGGAVLWVNGEEIGWLASYQRNLEESRDISVRLTAGLNEIALFFDDLAERDTRFFIAMHYVSGPAARVALPVPIAADVARGLEATLAALHFDCPSYVGENVRIVLPVALPCDTEVTVLFDGTAVAPDENRPRIVAARGTGELGLGSADRFPVGYRHVQVRLAAGGFEAERRLGIEICRTAGAAPEDLPGRVSEALEFVALHAEPGVVRALARLATGRAGAETDAMMAASLEAIEDCHDCADFELVPLLWARFRFGESLDSALAERIDRAILRYRYWMDEPGNDVQWYFSENHALLFHTAAYLAGHFLADRHFARSGRNGAEQSAIGRSRVRAWLDHFERWEKAEINSAPYFPIDLKGLLALHVLAPDRDIAVRAAAAVNRLLTIVARSSHHGMLTAAQGRSYEHSLIPGRSLELSAISRLVWGTGGLAGEVHALPLLALAVRDHGLPLPEELSMSAEATGPGTEEWRFAQGKDRYAALYHYKSADFALGSVAHYRWGEWGYQETLLHLRLGPRPEAQVFINHPGEDIQYGFGRPSYWGGCGTIGRVQQYRGLALVQFRANPEQVAFSHAWFPRPMFDDWRVEGTIALARCGAGGVALIGDRLLTEVGTGPTAGCELRLEGRQTRWLVRVAPARDLDQIAPYGRLAARPGPDDSVIVDDPDYGAVAFMADGRVCAEGRILDPAQWTIAGTVQRFEHAGERREAAPAVG
jgi:hypothetical protein